MLIVCFFYFLLTCVYTHPLHTMFEQFKLRFGRKYENEMENNKRFQIFIENKALIDDHNLKNESFTLKMNHFGDRHHDEFKSTLHGYDLTVLKRSGKTYNNFTHILNGFTPRNVDWVQKGKVSPVKDQQYCGGCWAFAIADATESRFAIAHNTAPVVLSVQEQLDCNHDGVNQGCTGGNLPEGYDYLVDHKGLCLARDYQFEGDDNRNKCRKRSRRCRNRSGQIKDYGIVYPYNEHALKKAVAQGPVAIAIEADDKRMQFYESGIFTSPYCGKDVDHAMTIVGYGEENGMKYWKIKGTWSDSWGEDGYIKVCRECGRNGRAGQCGVAVEAVFPIV